MTYTIYFEAAQARKDVRLHAWEPAGDIRDIPGTSTDSLHFQFNLDMATVDPSNISFKFWFPEEKTVWEPDDYIRQIPVPNAGEIWAFDYSPRCLTKDPLIAASPVSEIKFNVLTAHKYAGGKLFAWNSGTNNREWFGETWRDAANNISQFTVPVKPWMAQGFNFKLVSPDGNYEPERSNRVWRPADGGECWLKSGNINLQSQPLTLQPASIDLIYPRSVSARPTLKLVDDIDDFEQTYSAAEVLDYDSQFLRARFNASAYSNSLYWAEFCCGENQAVFTLPFKLQAAVSPSTFYAILGVSQWFNQLPVRDAKVRIIVHPNPGSQFGSTINLDWRTGYAPKSRYDAKAPLLQSISAARQADNTWQADFKTFANVPFWIDLLASPEGMRECRIDSPFMSQRNFQVSSGGPTVLHTVDGLSGFSRNGITAFEDISYADRAGVLAAAYSQAIVNAGVFSAGEMPHGATILGDQVWFVVYAPHAVRTDLLVLDPQSRPNAPRIIQTYPLKLTPDMRYYWCKLPKAGFPDPERILYRFRLEGVQELLRLDGIQEVIDPAAREVNITQDGYTWAEPGEGAEGTWAVVPAAGKIRARSSCAAWQTPDWSSLMVYELHPLRFTRDNTDAAGQPLPAFKQIIEELKPGRYLQGIGMTALEFLPVNEFPKNISWGYNPAIPFAIESSYGGPTDFADCVCAGHNAGKAVLLDVVFNHLNDSPVQAIAQDVYNDGETQWGAMVNYDHPVAIEFFRQGLVYLWHTFNLDGFRFDATEAIINGHIKNGYIIKGDLVGSGGGWEFLGALQKALFAAATGSNRNWPYLVAENDPDNWGIGVSGGVLDGQWDFELLYPLGEAAQDTVDRALSLKDVLNHRHNLWEVVRYAESHDAVSGQEDWKKRIAAREKWGSGMCMAKAAGTLGLLAKGIPMIFMGQEAGEVKSFDFDMSKADDPDKYLRLNRYLDTTTENNKVLDWFRNIIGLRGNRQNGFDWNDSPYVGYGNKTVAFTRADGRFFVIVTMGTPDTRQNLGWLGLPSNNAYKEIFNSTWPAFQVNNENEHTNGSYSASLTSNDIANLPEIGAVVLERR